MTGSTIILDRNARLHRIDENATERAPQHAYLRELQRTLRRRAGPPRVQGWPCPPEPGAARIVAIARVGHSGLYLRRDSERLLLWSEYRAAAAGLELEPVDRGGGVAPADERSPALAR